MAARAVRAAAGIALTALLCGACGASPTVEGPAAASSRAGVSSSAGDGDRAPAGSCAAAATAMPFPAEFPRAVPLPPGLMVTGSETRSGSRQLISGVRPGGFASTLEFMQREYPAAGFTLSGGEVEESDAESDFAGNGLRGRWAIREVPGCNGDTTIDVVVAPA
jgi:hypothetical protein